MTDRIRHADPSCSRPRAAATRSVAAVANGADAVYLGLKELNARRGAENFSLDELAEATPPRAPARRARLPDRQHPRARRRDAAALEPVDARLGGRRRRRHRAGPRAARG